VTAYWGVADPAVVEGTDAQKRCAFLQILSILEARIKLFASLPIRTLDRIRLQQHVEEIGKTTPPADDAR
jgi:arsenate reductase